MVVSFLLYVVINTFENVIHYNIGKFSNKETKFVIPNKKDWVKIIVVMTVAALLQGFFTYWFQSKTK
jgi:hypothetical protein